MTVVRWAFDHLSFDVAERIAAAVKGLGSIGSLMLRSFTAAIHLGSGVFHSCTMFRLGYRTGRPFYYLNFKL